MKTVKILSEVTFSEAAKRFFNFPMMNDTRMPFWIHGDGKSTFSEVLYDGVPIEIGKPIIVQIAYFEQAFLVGKLGIGSLFSLGTFPVELATGKIIDWNLAPADVD
ncbi:MAG: hypothetical protein WCR52_05175 [Bacteroidota bacterium]